MKQIAHTINRNGELVPANGFKKPTPTVAMQNRSIWMHSIDRTDSSDPIKGFAFAGIAIILMIGLLIAFSL